MSNYHVHWVKRSALMVREHVEIAMGKIPTTLALLRFSLSCLLLGHSLDGGFAEALFLKNRKRKKTQKAETTQSYGFKHLEGVFVLLSYVL